MKRLDREVAGTQDCASRLKVLADPTRLTVLRLLLRGPRQVGEINAVLHLEQSLLSHHLRLLRDAGLVTATREGKAVRYEVSRRSARAPRGTIDLGCCSLQF